MLPEIKYLALKTSMKIIIFCLLLLPLCPKCIYAQSAELIVMKMHQRYAGKWYKTFTFSQTTEKYRNDSLKKKETWYEAVQFPDKFRIDFGDIDSGNLVIFRGDSSYNFRKGKLKRTDKDDNDLTFLLGGMYFYPYHEVIEKLAALGYDLSKSFTTTWKKQPVYVIGASGPDERSNQLWIDTARLVLVRFLKYNDQGKEEGWLEDHIKIGNGYTETKFIFYFNDQLAQVEYYHNCTANPILKESLFDPARFAEWHWYKK
jgi:outer membrane lipoprotein-sorting protein